MLFSTWDFEADMFEREKYAVADPEDGISSVCVIKLCSR
jgi:hypothetical protein